MDKKNLDHGIYDTPNEHDEEKEDSTIGEDLPLSPSEQMSNQISVDRPPIEDEEFLPNNVEELSRAARAIAQLVPSDQVEFFYRSLHRLLDDSTDRAAEIKPAAEDAEKPEEPEEQGEKVQVEESRYREMINKVLTEMLSSDDVDELDAYRGRSYDTGGIDYFGDKELEDEMASSGKEIKSKSDGTVSLEQIAAEFGYSGPSGVRQEIKRLTDRLKYFVTNVKREDLDALVDYAREEYLQSGVSAGLFDQEDYDFLQSNPAGVNSSKGFRYFFVSQFVLPSYREVTRDSTRALNQGIDKLGVSDKLKTTIFNQVTGASGQGTIAKKLASMAKKGEITRDEAMDLVRKIESAMPALIAATDKSDDLVQRSLDRWQSMSPKKKTAAAKSAIESTEA